MRTSLLVTTVLTAALLAGVGLAQEHADDMELGAAVDALAATYMEGWNAGDAAACASTYTADAVNVDLFGASFSGRAAIQEAIVDTLETYQGSTIDLMRTSLHPVNDSLIVSDGTWEVKGSTAEGVPTKGFYTIVVTNVSGEWLISNGQVKVAPMMSE